jgi:hypothetical protein
MADDDDDDEAAMDQGIEPETDAKGQPQVAAGGPITATIPVRKGTRPISDRVREVFASSMAKHKASGKASDIESSLEPLDHEDLTQEPAVAMPGARDEVALEAPAETVAPAVAAAAPVAAPAVVAPPPPVIPPAPSLDPEVMRLRSEIAADREKLEQERQQWQTQSRASDVAKLRDVYFDKGAPAVVDVIKQWMPGLEGDDLKREVADLIQDLAHQYLEAPLDEPTKDRITNKRVRVGLKTWKQDQERAEEERQKQQAASQEEANKLRVKSILHQEVMKSDNASQYPWLASEDNAGDLVFETIEQEFKQSSTQLTWQHAAQRVNDFLEKRARAFYDKRAPLLSPKPPSAPLGEKQRTQGDKQVQQVTGAATKPKQPVAPQQPAAPPKKWSREQERANTLSKYRAQFQATADEE